MGRGGGWGGGVVKLLPRHSLKKNKNDVITTWKVNLCLDHVHFIINQRSMVLRRNKIIAVEGWIVSHYYDL